MKQQEGSDHTHQPGMSWYAITMFESQLAKVRVPLSCGLSDILLTVQRNGARKNNKNLKKSKRAMVKR
jgi:hypothetical protein